MTYFVIALITYFTFLFIGLIVPLLWIIFDSAIYYINGGKMENYKVPFLLSNLWDECQQSGYGNYIGLIIFLSLAGGAVFPLTFVSIIGFCVVNYLRYLKDKKKVDKIEINE